MLLVVFTIAGHNITYPLEFCIIKFNIYLRNEFYFSGVHGAMNRSGSRAK